jgi:hypothetical protein
MAEATDPYARLEDFIRWRFIAKPAHAQTPPP